MGFVVTVVGAHPGAGTSLVASGLAAALAEAGHRPVRLLDLGAGPAGPELAEGEADPAAAVVLDAPPTYDDHVLDALHRSERVLVVATTEGASLETLALVVESYSMLGLGRDRVAVVLNRVTSTSAAGAAAGEVQTLVGATVLAALPEAPELEAGSGAGQPEQTLDTVLGPRHPFGAAVRRLARALAADPERPAQPVLPFRRRDRGR